MLCHQLWGGKRDSWSLKYRDIRDFNLKNLPRARFTSSHQLWQGLDLGENDCTYIIVGFRQSE